MEEDRRTGRARTWGSPCTGPGGEERRTLQVPEQPRPVLRTTTPRLQAGNQLGCLQLRTGAVLLQGLQAPALPLGPGGWDEPR